MSKLVKQATDQLHTLIVDALGKAVADGDIPAEPIPAFNIEVPANRDNGDYSSNIAFVCAKITRYCIDLATLFHKFYNACRVTVEDEALMQTRRYLCTCVMNVITNILITFSISTPESM